jgi:hypothetical protein
MMFGAAAGAAAADAAAVNAMRLSKALVHTCIAIAL